MCHAKQVYPLLKLKTADACERICTRKGGRDLTDEYRQTLQPGDAHPDMAYFFDDSYAILVITLNAFSGLVENCLFLPAAEWFMPHGALIGTARHLKEA